jgi:hypothetical protein
MKRHRPPLVLAVLGLLLSCRIAAADQAGFAFLEVPAGARASALGGATCSMALGVEAVHVNPAGLSAVRGLEISATHYEYFQSLRHDQFAFATRLLGGGMSGSLRALYSEPIPERDELGNLTGTFGSHDLEFGLGYGRDFGAGLTMGMAAKLVRERIARSAAMTYGFDLGASLAPGRWHGLRLGAALQNAGPAAHYSIGGEEGAPVPLPTAFQTGVSYARASGGSFNLRGALEGRFTRGRSGVGIVGAEVEAPGVGAALRLGFRMNDDASSFSAGAGYAIRALTLDYAFVPYRFDLGDTHRVSLTTRF